jgi:hypothetical protein
MISKTCKKLIVNDLKNVRPFKARTTTCLPWREALSFFVLFLPAAFGVSHDMIASPALAQIQ